MNRIKRIRLERNITARHLARKALITAPYLSMIEQGRRPSKAVKNRLAKALGLPMKDLWINE